MPAGPLKYGLPLRPPTASTALWAHILRQDTQSSSTSSSANIPVIVPPIVPLDKNATSMRVLLHDTQANFEKFAIHVGKLIDGVNETKHEIKTTNDLFERDRETLMGDIIDLVNRSQKEIQKSVGSPCQTALTETYFKDVNHRLDTLDQRLDAIQAFNQTHSQALQTQIQAIQILLDKQGTIVSAVLPLLPLLQALPLHIEATRNTLNDAISALALAQKFPSDSHNQSVAVKITGKRTRSQSSSSSSPLPEPPSKRKNLTGNIFKDVRPTPRVPSFQEKADITFPTPKRHGPHQKSSPLTHMTDVSSHLNPFVLPNFSTPRKPLSNLLVHSPRQTPSHAGTLKFSNPLVNNNPVLRSNLNNTSRPSPPVLLEITPTAARPPRMLRVHASISSSMRNKPQPMEPSDTTTSGPMNHFQLNESEIQTSSAFPGPDVSTAPPAPAPFPPSKINHSATGDPQDGPRTINKLTILDIETDVQMPPPNQKVLSLGTHSTVALGNIKEFPRAGRRFIPLVDSEDEDEEQ